MSLWSQSRGVPNPNRVPVLAGYLVSMALVGAAALAAVLVDRVVQAPNLSLVFVLPVVISAVSFGFGPALTAAVAGAGAYNFLLIEPRFTFAVADPAGVWALVLLLIVAALVSAVAAQSRRRALAAWEAADQALALETLARALVAATDRKAIAGASAEALARLLKAPAAVFLQEGEGVAAPALAGGADLGEADHEAARWVMAAGLSTLGGVYPLDQADFDFWPVITPHRQRAVIGLKLAVEGERRPEPPERLVETVGGYLSVALDREAYAGQVLEGRVEMAHERLKSDLLAAVSHDLKTPLSTILVTLQSLRRFAGTHDAASRAELLALAEAEAVRLSAMVAKLLDMNRLEAGAVVVRQAPAHLAGLAAAALEQARPSLDGRVVINEIDPHAPEVLVDEPLFETALANVLENAGKYSPAGSAVLIRSGSGAGSAWIEVLDEGPGLPQPAEPLFEKFARGVQGDGRPAGTGLGLSIARGFLEAQGGRIGAANRLDRPGACVRLSVPLATAPAEIA
jgi:K+-sensing histidine kinase KdpD